MRWIRKSAPAKIIFSNSISTNTPTVDMIESTFIKNELEIKYEPIIAPLNTAKTIRYLTAVLMILLGILIASADMHARAYVAKISKNIIAGRSAKIIETAVPASKESRPNTAPHFLTHSSAAMTAMTIRDVGKNCEKETATAIIAAITALNAILREVLILKKLEAAAHTVTAAVGYT